MTGGVDDVDFGVLIMNGRIFGKDGDAALALEVVGVHHAFRHLLVGAERAALLEQLVHQRGLAVVNVRNDGNVSDSRSFHNSMIS